MPSLTPNTGGKASLGTADVAGRAIEAANRGGAITPVSVQPLPVRNPVSGPDTAVDGNLAVFDGASGRAVKDGGTIAALISAVLAIQYPVGGVYESTNASMPAAVAALGTWVALGAGQFAVGYAAGDPDFGTLGATGGAKTVASSGVVAAPTFTGSALGTHTHAVTAAGTNTAPTFTGSALGTHTHAAGSLVPSAHAGTAVAAHASHTHDVTSNVSVDPHAETGGSIGLDLVLQGPDHNVTNGLATSSGPSASLTHSVTQPDAHTMSGTSGATGAGTPAGTVAAPVFSGSSVTSAATSAGTPAGTNSAPAFTGSATSVLPPFFVLNRWVRTV